MYVQLLSKICRPRRSLEGRIEGVPWHSRWSQCLEDGGQKIFPALRDLYNENAGPALLHGAETDRFCCMLRWALPLELDQCLHQKSYCEVKEMHFIALAERQLTSKMFNITSRLLLRLFLWCFLPHMAGLFLIALYFYMFASFLTMAWNSLFCCCVWQPIHLYTAARRKGGLMSHCMWQMGGELVIPVLVHMPYLLVLESYFLTASFFTLGRRSPKNGTFFRRSAFYFRFPADVACMETLAKGPSTVQQRVFV